VNPEEAETKKSSKLLAVMEKVEEVKKKKEKCVVYTQFLKMLANLEKEMVERKIEYTVS